MPPFAQIITPETVQIDWFAQLQQGGVVIIVQGVLVIALPPICRRWAPPAAPTFRFSSQ